MSPGLIRFSDLFKLDENNIFGFGKAKYNRTIVIFWVFIRDISL